MNKIILIDGHNLLFRMFYGIPSSIKNSKGKEIRGLIGFIGSLKKNVDEFQPYSIIVIFDSQSSKNSNLKIDKNYKQNRADYTNVADDDNPFSQLPLIKKALKYLNICFLEVNNYEADDYIASIINNNRDNKYIIVSTDYDFIQLVSNNTFLYVPRGKNSVLYTPDEVIKKYSIPSSKFVIFKSLVGDKSDNIRGVRGIGNISAAKILNYGSIQNYINANPDSKTSKLLISNKEIISKNQKLICMINNIDTSIITFNKLSKKIFTLKTYEIIEKIGER